METVIREKLLELADDEYQKFSASLIPGISNMLGVRIPELRKMAKQIAKEDWRAYLQHAESDYFEEIMLQGMLIEYVKADVDEKLELTSSFIPKIDNWSVCDSFCTGLKFTKNYQDLVWEFLQPYLQSDKEYEIRFGVVMLLNYYVNETYIERVLHILDNIRYDAYYVRMAVAWALSICYVKQPKPTMTYLQQSSVDDFTYNKALQKITESLRVDAETKRLIRSMKRLNS
ncbi:DNA alkylation repair protein [Paenibacillus sp.]|jgi:3-methyladenine DNA glycosylase AlkD|uniref:DNA alkylation repair protein n=1 Tax=Paenibacillus sp. TaxID=58172 RepID=UPI002820DEA5|nr:DNA alkylation repair protein [Paenibacillus sp.]MDR0271488.1 DNA alkylation repair protein [Paenibacillus sp.]